MHYILHMVSKILQQAFGSQLRRNMSSGVVRAVINLVALAFCYPLYLHYLGYEKYGVWLVLATVLTFAQMGNLGITQAVTKLVAEEHGRGDVHGMQSYVSMGLMVLSVSGAVVLLIILCFKSQIIAAFGLSADNEVVARWLLPYIGLLSVYVFLVQTLNGTVMGLGRMDLANYLQMVSRITAVTVAVWLLSAGRGIESLLIGNTLSYVVIHIGSLFFIRRITRLHFFRISNWDRRRLGRLFQFGGGVFGSSLVGMLVEPFNKLMLSRYAGVATVPVFEIAFKGAVQVRTLLESGLRAMMPEISRLSGVGTVHAWDRIRAVNRRAIRLILLGGLPVYGALFIGAEILLRLWLRDSYIAVIPAAFRIMLIATFLSLLCVPAFHTLMGLGKVHYCLLASVIIAAANFTSVILILLLTRSISVNSIGGGLMIAFGLSSLYVIYKTRHLLSIEATKDD